MSGKVVPFFNPDNAAIQIKRSQEFKDEAQKLSDFVKDLPLSSAENEKLVALMVNQVLVAEKNAFMQGASMALDIVRDHV